MEQSSVFISYSRKDEKEKDELIAHLHVLGQAVEVWSDDRLGAGSDWKKEIEQAMDQAQVAILLITVNFLNSNFILNEEAPRLLERHRKNDGLTVLPVIARYCAWQNVPWLNQLNIRPRNANPVWREQGIHAEEELATIANEVASLVKGDRPKSSTPLSEVKSQVKPANVREVPGNEGREKRQVAPKRWVSRALGGAIVGATAGTLAAPNEATIGWLIGGALGGAMIGLLSEVVVRALVGEIVGLLGEIIIGTLVGALIGVIVGVLGWLVNELIVEALAEELIAGALIGGIIGGIVGAIGWKIRGP